MKRNILILLLTLLCSLSASAQDPCQMVMRMIGEAEMMVLDGNYEKALKLLRAVAADPETQGCSNLRLVRAKIAEIEAKVPNRPIETITVKGVSFVMTRVQGGTFTMGATSEQGSDANDNEKPTHKVTLSDYLIGETEVTQALWQAVMGNNPSKFKGDNLPVERVSWDDCQEFIRKLNSLTGRSFRLPTEAEWEYAARGGKKSNGTKYSGSSAMGSVGWYKDNCDSKTHPVKTKNPNELDLYDMSGNVYEWCNDYSSSYSSSSQTNPQGPSSGSTHAVRGGGYLSSAAHCRGAYRIGVSHDFSNEDLGLRLALSPSETITVKGVSFVMVSVQGGTFTMGATSEQGSDAWDEEKPAHQVTLSDYSIGETEVTQALWQAVMGSNPSKFKGDNLPVEKVSWDDCQEFIRKLNSLTGRRFRLPTEAEWEYAARGGNKSRGTKYAGSNEVGSVGWYKDNCDSKTHPVKTKNPNELGLYDMTGNVNEWCNDWRGTYSSSSQTNPQGPSSGTNRVDRGGSWIATERGCRVSRRGEYDPVKNGDGLGLRLAL